MKKGNFFKKWYLNLLAKRLKKYELDLLPKLDGILAITKVDADYFLNCAFSLKLDVCPLGVDLTDYPFQGWPATELSIFHLGSMDWMPNIEGVEWFLESCWPVIHLSFPELPLFLAGKNFPTNIKERNLPSVTCHGKVDDAKAYMKSKSIMIVPLRSGSGMRVKIIEGLALGKTIISTTIGAEGIEVENKKNILLADTVQEFLDAIRFCIANPEQAAQIGINGRKLAEEKYSIDAIGKMVTGFYSN